MICFVLFSCENGTEATLSEQEVEVAEVEVIEKEPVDAERFVDFDLVGEHEVIEEEQNVFSILIDGEPQEILVYQGKLVDARNSGDGYMMYFEPYSFWDDNLEMQVESETNFKMVCSVSKDQANYLGSFEDAPLTGDIKWDYYENLFMVYSYLDGDQNNIPIKFEDEGKTEWDG